MARGRKKTFKHYKEIIGFSMMLISIIGFFNLGIVGQIITGIYIFLFGSLFKFGIIGLFLYGLYIVIKRKKFNFFSINLIGIYIFIIGILTYIHLKYISENSLIISETIKDTVDQFVQSLQGVIVSTGGGIIGTLLSLLFEKLFALNGAIIVSIALIMFGMIIFLNVSIIDVIKFIVEKFKNLKLPKKSKQEIQTNISEEEIKINLPEEKEEHKKIITNLDELKEEKPKEEKAIINSNSNYILPDIKELLNAKKGKNLNENKNHIKTNVEKLEKVLNDFDIVAKVVGVNVGPAVTQYEMELKSGTKVSKVLGISREIALSLAAKDVRIQAPIPGKSTIGIELPNPINALVTLREVLEDIPKSMDSSKLCVALGKNIMGKTTFMEINKTPHLLVAGATGSGKSCCINSIIVSILTRATPEEVKLVLVDPKKVEMGMYNGIPHLLMPVVTDPKKASVALIKMVSEMERRYEIFSDTKTKNILDYNDYVEKRNKNMNGELEKLPYIVIIIDELADLMLVAAKEVEDSIMRITQMARAAGIHLIVATQRPSTDIITGVVKANIPSRISFAVSSSIDSRTILDMMGAEKLLGKGDMLFIPMGENVPTRIQGAFVTDEEVKKVVDYAVGQQIAKFDDKFNLTEKTPMTQHTDDEEYEDPLYTEIVEFVIRSQKASASLLQRKYKLGYNRAARIIDLLEERGIVGPQNGSKPREVLIELEDNQD